MTDRELAMIEGRYVAKGIIGGKKVSRVILDLWKARELLELAHKVMAESSIGAGLRVQIERLLTKRSY